ncbi:MAG: pentapeptide repeat-containing protein [Cyanobacteria bacterium J06597_16]
MTNDVTMNYLALLESGIDNWNQWRAEHPDEECDLSGQDLREGYFFEGNFSGVNLTAARLNQACLIGANLSGANLSEADLSGAYMGDANLQGANLSQAILSETNLNRADLRQANLTGANVAEANTYKAQFSKAQFSKAQYSEGLAECDAASQQEPVLEPKILITAQNAEMISPRQPTLPQLDDEPFDRSSGGKSLPLVLGRDGVDVVSRDRPLVNTSSASSSSASPSEAPPDLPTHPLKTDIPATGVVAEALISETLVTEPLVSEPLVSEILSAETLTTETLTTESLRPGKKSESTPEDVLPVKPSRSKFALPTIAWSKKKIALAALAASVMAVVVGVSLGAEPSRVRPAASIRSADAAGSKGSADLVLTQALKSADQIWAVATHTTAEQLPIVVGGGEGGDIKIWNRQTGAALTTLRGHQQTVRALAISPSGQWLVSGSGDGIKVWDLQQQNSAEALTYNIPAGPSPIWALAISPNGRTFASADYDGKVTIWQLADGQPVYSVEHGASVWSLAIAPDGQTFVSSGSDRVIREWDLISGQPLRTFEGHEDVVRSVAISADAKTLASGSWDSTIKLWNFESGALETTLSGHEGRVVAIALSPDGQTLASGGTDNALKLWDVPSRKLLETLDNSTNWILSVAFAERAPVDGKADLSPEKSLEKTLVSGGKDRTIKVWQ